MAIRRLLRGEMPEAAVESVAREVARRHDESLESVRRLDTDNWLSTPCVVNEHLFVKIVTQQNTFVHGLLTTGRNIGVFSSGTEGFFERFEAPVEMAQHDLEATRKMRESGLNVPKPLEVFEHEGLGVLVMEFLPEFETFETLPSDTVESYAPALFDSLSVMHDAGIVHGDLHAENVLIADDELYFIDATKVDEGAIEEASAYDIACALAVLEPLIGARRAVEIAADQYPDDVLLAADSYLDFVNLRPEHDFSPLVVKGEIDKQVS